MSGIAPETSLEELLAERSYAESQIARWNEILQRGRHNNGGVRVSPSVRIQYIALISLTESRVAAIDARIEKLVDDLVKVGVSA